MGFFFLFNYYLLSYPASWPEVLNLVFEPNLLISDLLIWLSIS